MPFRQHFTKYLVYYNLLSTHVLCTNLLLLKQDEMLLPTLFFMLPGVNINLSVCPACGDDQERCDGQRGNGSQTTHTGHQDF